MEPLLQLRHYTPEDYGLLCRWWKEHKIAPPPITVLPKLGVIVEEHRPGKPSKPQAAVFLYMDNSVGVCFLEHAVSTPNLPLLKARKAFLTLLDFMKRSAASMDYGVMYMHTHPAIARIVKAAGFIEGPHNLVCMAATTH